MSMEWIVLFGLVSLGFGLLAILILKKSDSIKNNTNEQLLHQVIQSSIGELRNEFGLLSQTLNINQSNIAQTLTQTDRHVTSTLQKSYEEMNKRLDNATQVMSSLKEETGKFSEIGRSMKDLQQLLASPKLRGGLGEHILKELLSQMLPRQTFKLQHRFLGGETADAVIITQAGLISIDAKFPLENYNKYQSSDETKEAKTYHLQFERDVKKHIKDIGNKYIKPMEKTVDFALMYIPSEAVYYEIMTQSPDVHDFAQRHRVLPVSPATFYAFLRTILLSFEGQKIANEAQSVIRSLREIKDFSIDFGEKLNLTHKHMQHAYSSVQSLSQNFLELQTKISETQHAGDLLSSKPKEANEIE